MFYCNDCGEKRKWPVNTILRSKGRCEICEATRMCNDVQSKHLPVPRKERRRGDRRVAIGGWVAKDRRLYDRRMTKK